MNYEFDGSPTFTGRVRNEVYDWVESAVFVIVVMMLIFSFFSRMIVVSGQSMEPTLHHEDRLVSSRLFYKPKAGDIVVVTQPHNVDEALIKRVIATEGQTLDINFEKGTVWVDGQKLDEPYINEPTYSQYDMEFPIVIEEGKVFVMGDNRNASKDSRNSDVGQIDERYILGKIYYRVSPLQDWGIPDSYWKEKGE